MSEPFTPIEKALAASLGPGRVRDVCLYAFSRRLTSPAGIVSIDHPLPVIAIGSVLKEEEYFASLLESGFAESQGSPTAVSSFFGPMRQSAQESEYDYESDSDLDDEDQGNDDRSTVTPGSSSNASGIPAAHSDGAQSTNHQEIMIPNVAHRTLHTLVFFMYTGKITFLPLQSQGVERRDDEMRTFKSLGIPACSPKSLYRLADAYGMKELQERALHAIMQRLTIENVVDEAFSSFCCRYESLHERAMGIIERYHGSVAVQQSLRRIIPKLVMGEFPNSAPTLEALLKLQKLDPGKPQPWVGSSASEYAENSQASAKPPIQESPSSTGIGTQSAGWTHTTASDSAASFATHRNATSPIARPRGPFPRARASATFAWRQDSPYGQNTPQSAASRSISFGFFAPASTTIFNVSAASGSTTSGGT